MTTTITCELRVRPEYLDDAVSRATEQLRLTSGTVVGRRHARLYQHLDDPNHLLYIGEWASRISFEAYVEKSPMPGEPQHFQAIPVCHLYRRLALFEHVLAPVDIAYVDLVSGAPETLDARRDLMLNYHRAEVRHLQGLSMLMMYECMEAPHDLLLVSGWQCDVLARAADQSVAVRSVSDPSSYEALVEQLRATGGTVNRFAGRPLLDSAQLDAASMRG